MDTILLNLTDISNPIIQFIQNHNKFNNNIDFFKSILLSRSITSYESTKIISNYAYSKGFHGIVYKSVRTENDMAHPDSNLVMFDESKVNIFKYSFEKVDLNH